MSNWFSIGFHTWRNLRIFHSSLIKINIKGAKEYLEERGERQGNLYFSYKKFIWKNHKSMFFSLFRSSKSYFPFYYSFVLLCTLRLPMPINQYLSYRIQYWILYRNFGRQMFSMLWLYLTITYTRYYVSGCVCAIYVWCLLCVLQSKLWEYFWNRGRLVSFEN